MPTIPLTRLRAPRRNSQVSQPVYQIAVVGDDNPNIPEPQQRLAEQVGKGLALRHQVVVVPAGDGIPSYIAAGAKSESGQVIGFSGCLSRREHKQLFSDPDEYYTAMVYTGSGYDDRNQIMLRSCQAVLFITGQQGIPTIISRFEQDKVVGVLTVPLASTNEIGQIIAVAKQKGGILYDSDPLVLIDKVIAAVKQRQAGGLAGRH